MSSLWPEHYLKRGISPTHCSDVLAGCYDVPYGINQPPVILDIGANIGAFAMWSSKRWPGAIIHCYEPHPVNAELLRETCRLIPGVLVTEAAVSRSLETARLRDGKNNCGECSLYDVGEQSEGSIVVRTIAADSLPASDIVKIDTEGAELEIIRGLANSGKLARTSAVMLEYHRDSDVDPITSIIESAGLIRTFRKARCRDRGELKFLRNPPRVFIAVPNNDDPHFSRTRECIDRIRSECPFPIYGAEVAGDGVARARNNLVAAALQTDATHVLFVDSDTLPLPRHVNRLAGHRLPVVAGLYAKKQPKQQWVASAIDGAERDPTSGLQEVDEIGTGAMMVDREVFHAMIAAFPDSRYENDPHPGAVRHDFFPMHATGGRYLSEDWYFCKRAREIGFKIFADWNVIVGHRGSIVYPLASFLSDDDVIDLMVNVTGHSAESVRSFMASGPRCGGGVV